MDQLPINLTLSRQLADKLNISSLRQRRLLKRPVQGNCYHDALEVLTYLGSGWYCEGWAKNWLHVEHAWVVYEGQVVDVTWEADDLVACSYSPTISVSLGAIISTGGYKPPIVWDRDKLKRLGYDAMSTQQWHNQRLFELCREASST